MPVKNLQKIPKKADSVYYLKLLEKFNIDPNFWCSEEYFKFANFELHFLDEIYWVEEPGIIHTCIFPPIHIITGDISEPPAGYSIWSDFESDQNRPSSSKFLDYEYFYDPKDFLKMNGKKWTVFRKNIRKWKRSNEKHHYDWIFPKDNIHSVLLDWLKSNESRNIHDDEILWKYFSEGQKRKVLRGDSGKIYGINIWDENWKYINYHYCIVRPEPFLSEYMRYLFYMDNIILYSNKLVNDGGVLDNPNLKKFKDKLNPCYIRSIYSWEKNI